MPSEATWTEIKQKAINNLSQYGKEYCDRLYVEIKEFEKQGLCNQFVNKFNDGFKYNTNKSGLVLPWSVGMTDVDPLTSKHEWIRQTDIPDVDVDCLPYARRHIKKYIADKYGKNKVCSVGAWQTYKFKAAIGDVVRALGADKFSSFTHNGVICSIQQVVHKLPDDVDGLKDGGYAECTDCKEKHKDCVCPKCGSKNTDGLTIGMILEGEDAEGYYSELRAYAATYPLVIEYTCKIMGKIKALSRHAGGMIISNVDLMGIIPLGKTSSQDDEDDEWTSMWTEGRNTQLSKFGFVKWDILGLNTLGYIDKCCRMIEKVRGCKFDVIPWNRNDPRNNTLGKFIDEHGVECDVLMDDKAVFRLFNEARTETIFQFETGLQKGLLKKYGVKTFYDLQVLSAMGHPGPILCIPDYIDRRDDPFNTWTASEHPEIVEILKATKGIIVYQEDLQAIWQKFGGFSGPESEAARKAVAKKWTHKLKPIKDQWLRGATKTLGAESAEAWWQKMVTFGRYAFNKSHSCAYIVEAYWCAWLRVHFKEEWWASVLSQSASEKIERYIRIAKTDGVSFGEMNINNLQETFAVDKDTMKIIPGFKGIKGIGDKLVEKYCVPGKFNTVDEFVDLHGKNKGVMRKLIHLGAFKVHDENIKLMWLWYIYRHASPSDEIETAADIVLNDTVVFKTTPEMTVRNWRVGVKASLLLMQGHTGNTIKNERDRQISEYKRLYPKRNKIPTKIINYSPTPNDSFDEFKKLYADQRYKIDELIDLEKELLGYRVHSLISKFQFDSKNSIKNAMRVTGNRHDKFLIDMVVEKKEAKTASTGTNYHLITIDDGNTSALLTVFNGADEFKLYHGYRISVSYNDEFDRFSMKYGSKPIPLAESDV